MSHAKICDGKCKGMMVSGKLIEVQGYDEDGETRTLHYCKKDFLTLKPSDLLPHKEETSVSISWIEAKSGDA